MNCSWLARFVVGVGSGVALIFAAGETEVGVALIRDAIGTSPAGAAGLLGAGGVVGALATANRTIITPKRPGYGDASGPHGF